MSEQELSANDRIEIDEKIFMIIGINKVELTEDFFEGGPHDCGIGVDPSPVFNTNHSLADEHTKAVDHLASLGPCIADEVGGGWIGNDIGYDHVGPEGFGVEVESGIEVGKETDRGCVDYDISLGGN